MNQIQEEKVVTNKHPIHTAQVGGVRISMWEDKNIQISKTYKVENEWKNTKVLYLSDIPNVILALQKMVMSQK